MTKLSYFLLAVVFIVISCKKDEPKPEVEYKSPFIGKWQIVYSHSYDSGYRYYYPKTGIDCGDYLKFINDTQVKSIECADNDVLGTFSYTYTGSSMTIVEWQPSSTRDYRYDGDTLIFYDPIENEDFGYVKVE